ncbi:MAG: biotin--[acetyl-CoA-carboxylase] ligase [Acidobacteria bacterium]|nr:biotin--[acetyl-CoA-carboxylase] ligase [Acidobacteriota bacterium]
MMMEQLPPDIARALGAAAGRLGAWSEQVVYRSVVPSTNDVARQLAVAGAAHGTTVLAGAQTAGRGRQGRRWFSAPGAGLYCSVVVRDIETAVVTLAAGVAAAEAVHAATGLPVELKWPNDVMLPARPNRGAAKVGGILTEAARRGGVAEAVIVGVGINVTDVAFPPEIAGRAGSLGAALGAPADRGVVLVELLAALAYWLRMLAAGDVACVLDRWRAMAPSCTGAEVEWRVGDAPRRGVTAGIDRDGALLVCSGERVERLVAGEVTWVAAPFGAPRGFATGC